MDEVRVNQLLARAGAVISGHFVFTSGRHGDTYINKDAIFPHTHATNELCRGIALQFDGKGVEVVVAPEKGAIAMEQWVAYWLQKWNVRTGAPEILGVYAEKEGDGFVFRRGHDELVRDKKILVVEDLLTTGGSAKKTVDAVRAIGGTVIGVGALANRGGVTKEDIGVPELVALANPQLHDYAENECPLCKQGVPINTEVGHGKKFLERQGQPV